jgi:hypothetical protein
LGVPRPASRNSSHVLCPRDMRRGLKQVIIQGTVGRYYIRVILIAVTRKATMDDGSQDIHIQASFER